MALLRWMKGQLGWRMCMGLLVIAKGSRGMQESRGEQPSMCTRIEDEGDNPTFIQQFPSPPKTYGQKQTCWEKMHDERLAGKQGRWGGFADEEEWELARWFMKCAVSQTEIDNCLKLPIVSI
jgi:hypothetical protein